MLSSDSPLTPAIAHPASSAACVLKSLSMDRSWEMRCFSSSRWDLARSITAARSSVSRMLV